jgi:uncharacterized Fe-S cluster-containing radical SAM superfamily protein
MTIDTEAMSARLRAKSVDRDLRRLLVTKFVGTRQEADLAEPPNCGGFGRIRHFTRATSDGWPENPLPLDPGTAALGLDRQVQMNAQVFQNAVCNWRCWYCYVPFNMLNGDPERSAWIDAPTLVDWYLDQVSPPPMIDLSGGQPDLVPEWTLWMVEALTERQLANPPFLWIDDNLSNDYYWRYLTDEDIATIAAYPSIGRVGCFKGYDAESFAFNTGAAEDLFDQQFALFERHLRSGVDTYGYATFTSAPDKDPSDAMNLFVDRLQQIDESLPLRVVPLEVQVWGPVAGRMGGSHQAALDHQWRAIDAWTSTIVARFSSSQRATPINEVPSGYGP